MTQLPYQLFYDGCSMADERGTGKYPFEEKHRYIRAETIKKPMDDRQHADLANNIRNAVKPYLAKEINGIRVDVSQVRGVISGEILKWRKNNE